MEAPPLQAASRRKVEGTKAYISTGEQSSQAQVTPAAAAAPRTCPEPGCLRFSCCGSHPRLAASAHRCLCRRRRCLRPVQPCPPHLVPAAEAGLARGSFAAVHRASSMQTAAQMHEAPTLPRCLCRPVPLTSLPPVRGRSPAFAARQGNQQAGELARLIRGSAPAGSRHSVCSSRCWQR